MPKYTPETIKNIKNGLTRMADDSSISADQLIEFVDTCVEYSIVKEWAIESGIYA